MAKILVVEDDYNIGFVILQILESEHYVVDVMRKGVEAQAAARPGAYDLVILDWTLPDIQGVDICRSVRSSGAQFPILMLSARGTVAEKAMGLDAGADDYLVKPFDPVELLARVRALLRRPAAVVSDAVLEARDVKVDTVTRRVTRNGQEIQLRPKEYALLELLMRHPNQSFTADALLFRLWQCDAATSVDTVRTHVKRLREKLGDTDDTPLIASFRGVGYKIVSMPGSESRENHEEAVP